MTKEQLIKNIREKKSFLCVGLDTDLSKIPAHLLKEEDPIFEFNKQIIDATQQYCVAFKPNTAFYECYGVKGWISLQKTIQYIKQNYPNQFVIADAKRGDIGNTSTMYAKAFFEELNADAVTVAPYMGKDSVEPFLKFDGKWAIVLALTSNDGSKDFQTTPIPVFRNEEKLEVELLAEQVLKKSSKWGTTENMMYVIGATRAQLLKAIRAVVPNHFFLVPGVGAQGGSLKEVVENGMNDDIGLLVNASRSILYASNGSHFAEDAAAEAKKLQQEMATYL
ncbi:MAG: orotidine-5'-phosphate decarboxylase [Bacteroidota bacterium]